VIKFIKILDFGQGFYLCQMKWWVCVFLLIVSHAAKAVEYELFELGGKVGLKDEYGKIILPATFESLGWSDGSFSVIGQTTGYKLDDHWGIVNLNKEFVTKPIYETLTYSGGSLIIARRKVNAIESKSGCLNPKGEVEIPFEYDGIQINALQAIVFKKQGGEFRYGLINLKNEIVIPMEYARISSLGTTRYAVENSKGQTALFSDQGNLKTLFSIDSISVYKKKYAVFHQGFKQGLIDREGNIAVEAHFKKITISDNETIMGQLPSVCQILTGDNQQINKIEADGLVNSYSKLYKIKRGNWFGLCDDQLTIVIPPQFEVLTEIGNNQFLAKKKNYGIIRKDNSVVLPFEFDSIIVEKGLARVKEKTSTKNSWVIYDTLGKRRSDNNYEWIGEKRDNYFSIKKRGYWGVLNLLGEEVIHCVYDSILNHVGEAFAVKLKNGYGIINSREDWLMAPQPIPIKILKENRIFMTKDNMNFIKDFAHNIIYFSKNTFSFNPEYMIENAAQGGERKLDYDGRVITSPSPVKVEKVETVFSESEGYRGIKKDGKFGFVDKRGNLRISNRYEAIQPFKEGLAAIKLNNKWGYINMDERIIIQPLYEFVSQFEKGKALVKRNKKYGLINREGKSILPARYDSIHTLPEKNYLLIINGLKGLADKEGRVIIEPKFDQLTDLNNGYFIAERDGKFGLLTQDGLSTIPLVYDHLTFNQTKNNYLVLQLAEWQTIGL
jgi:hypothetical protein